MYCKAKKKLEQSEKFWKFLFLKIYFIKNVWKVGFQIMLILGLLGMYFDATVVFVTKSLLLFRLAVAILCQRAYCTHMYCKYEALHSHLCVLKNPLLARGQRSCLRGSSFVAENGCEVILGGSDRLEPMWYTMGSNYFEFLCT